MHDLGYERLRIVNDFHAPLEAALLEDRATQKSAVHAASVLAGATQHETLAAAIADCTFVVGTTAVGARVLEHPVHTLAAAVPLVERHLTLTPDTRVALLFGSEKTGLSNEELSHCHALLTIPMNQRAEPGEPTRHLSMNLGQAAAVCLYTLAQSEDVSRAPGAETTAPPNAAEEERLTILLLDLLDRSGYTRRHPANSREAVIRRLVRRMANTSADATVWSGILRQLRHALGSEPL
jgi:TrmH family RNA methyltransferase